MPEISDTWLKINYWFLTHKNDLRKWWVIVFLAIDIFFVIFVLTNTLIYLISIPRQDRLFYRMTSQTVSYQTVREKSKPSDLVIEDTQAVPAGYQNIDIIMKVKNPNEKWAAIGVRYKFNVDGNETDIFENFILPKEERFIFGFSVEYKAPAGSLPRKIEPIIDKINWQRIKDVRKFPDVKFEVNDIDYSFTEVTEERLKVVNLTASVKNNSIYDFWSARFDIVLYSNSKIIGVNQANIEKFKAFETKEIFSRWTDISENITEAVVTPNVNILDTRNFM